MKSIKEKQLLVKWSKAMNEPIDADILEEVERYNTLQKDVLESVRKNTISDLIEAQQVAEELVTKINSDYPKPPTLEELMSLVKEEANELVQTQPKQISVTEETPTLSAKPAQTLAEKAANHITKEVKLEEKADSFQQPNPPSVDKNFEAVQKKLKFLEQAIGRIAATGPGSGETRFLRLDDVNYSSWQDRDRHKILKYEPNTNPAYDGVTFGFLTGDQGPVYSIKFDETGYTSNANVSAGLIAWNSEKDCLDIHQADNTICQVGLENYIKVYNDKPYTLSNGDFVVFTGVKNSIIEAPTVAGFLADANAIPLYSVGVLTNDLTSNSLGRATTLGEVHEIDASGANAGNVLSEIWNVGDLLWASPSHPGKLTKYQPTAPNVAVSVAAVLNNDSTDGLLLVRPTIFPRQYYAEYSSNVNQTAPNTNFGHAVTFNSLGVASGFVKNNNNTDVIILHTGLYNVRAKLQFSSTNASQQSVYIWARKNGIDIPDSTIHVTSVGNNASNAPIWNRNVSLQAGDRMTIMWSVTSTDVTLRAESSSFAPNTSSAVFTIFQVDL